MISNLSVYPTAVTAWIPSTPRSGREGFEFRPLGHGMQNFPAILEAVQQTCAQWVVVEQDSSVGRPTLEAARMSREYLHRLGW
ncbi:MAG TPA: hypothetical protein DD640_08615 [Clostridiales bacterium]|nr:hypothetical protein [Clostridiales bacterium]